MEYKINVQMLGLSLVHECYLKLVPHNFENFCTRSLNIIVVVSRNDQHLSAKVVLVFGNNYKYITI